ncbi:MAG: hypothetical protein WAT66_09400 [Actinomycetota bacterium]
MKRTFGTIALIFVLALSACGGSSKTPSATKTTSPTTGTDTSAADKAKAEKLVLIQADFPAGWTATPPSPDPKQDSQDKELAACVGAVDPAVSESATVDGPDLNKDTAIVSTTASFVKTNAYAQTDLKALTSPKLESCIKDFGGQALKEGLEESGSKVTLKSVEVDPIPTKKYGDATLGRRITATIVLEGQELAAYIDLVFILKGRAEVSAFFAGIGQPFDAALERSLIDKLGAKLTAV